MNAAQILARWQARLDVGNPLLLVGPEAGHLAELALSSAGAFHRLGRRVLLRSARELGQEYVTALARQRMDSFRELYRREAEGLVVLGLEHEASREVRQTIYFTFAALADKGCPVLATVLQKRREQRRLIAEWRRTFPPSVSAIARFTRTSSAAGLVAPRGNQGICGERSPEQMALWQDP